MNTVNTAQRWSNAIQEIKHSDITVRENVDAECGCCINWEDLGLSSPDEAFAFTYEDGRYFFHHDVLVLEDYEDEDDDDDEDVSSAPTLTPLTAIYFNHGNGAGEQIAAAFKSNGFDVDWDGTDEMTVTILLGGE